MTTDSPTPTTPGDSPQDAALLDSGDPNPPTTTSPASTTFPLFTPPRLTLPQRMEKQTNLLLVVIGDLQTLALKMESEVAKWNLLPIVA